MCCEHLAKGTECLPIPPTYVKWSDPTAIGLLCLVLVGLILTSLTLLFWVIHKQNKLIKTSSIEVSMTILVGILWELITALLYLSKPSLTVCISRVIGFHLSVTVVYSSLLLKTNRVFRIFSAGKRGNKKPWGIGSGTQVSLIGLVICIQVREGLNLMRIY